MPSYIIKFSDEFGDWFLERPGGWSDRAADALIFTAKDCAAREAEAAQARLRARPDQPPFPLARVHVIQMRAL